MFMRNDRVVLSMDLRRTFSLPDSPSCACFSGLKLRTVEIILLEIVWRERTSRDRQLRVASIRSASLPAMSVSCSGRAATEIPLFFVKHVE